jgi:hypothetical protein
LLERLSGSLPQTGNAGFSGEACATARIGVDSGKVPASG